jgi:glucose-6-phosphate dehydrogenase assembly protein OpcA
MKVELIETSASTVRNELIRMCAQMGALMSGVVLNLVVMTDESDQYDALRAATQAAREHPCQILAVIAKTGRRPRRLDAELTVGENMPGQMAVLRIHGELNLHIDSVITPLLVPDTPVVIWWPGKAPDAPAADALGMLGQRRITDAAADEAPRRRLLQLAAVYRPGDTDLAWGRATNWRSLLAATLDSPYPEILEAAVGAEADNPTADLIAAWLRRRLAIPVSQHATEGPGVTEVSFITVNGKMVICRLDGRNATLSRPGEPDRYVALHRRDTAELLAEELRRLDPDEVYGETLAELVADEQAAAAQSASAAANEV